MSTLIYPGGCDESFLEHLCSPCPVTESGRVRHIAFVHTSIAFTDQTDPAEWEAGILAKKIHVIPNVNGTYDGGTPTIGNGFGDVPRRKTGVVFKLAVIDPNFIGNCDFYNTISSSFNYRIAFCSETRLQISDKACLLTVKDPIQEPVESERYWNLDIEFSQKLIPCHTTIPGGIFLCIDVV